MGGFSNVVSVPLIGLMVVGASACGGGTPTRSSSTTASPTTTTVSLLAAGQALLAVENTMSQAVAGPEAALQQAAADAAAAYQQASQSVTDERSVAQAARQQTTATCQQSGYGSDACRQALASEQATISGQGQTVQGAAAQAGNRLANDLGTVATNLRQLRSIYLSTAASLAAIDFPPATKSDAQSVETALSAAATAAEDAATTPPNNAALVQGAMSSWRGALNSYRLAVATLHTDLGLPPPA